MHLLHYAQTPQIKHAMQKACVHRLHNSTQRNRDFRGVNVSKPDRRTELNIETLSSRGLFHKTSLPYKPGLFQLV